jgi:hypothetical protein
VAREEVDAIDGVLDMRILHAGTGTGDPRFRLLPESAFAYSGRVPADIAMELRRFRPDVVVAEVYGQPKTFTRSYGSPARRVMTPIADPGSQRGH